MLSSETMPDLLVNVILPCQGWAVLLPEFVFQGSAACGAV